MTDFETIYRQYSPQVFRVCMGYINNYEQAKDLTQETFVAVWRHLGSFRQHSKISTWIFRIATNNCLRAIQKNVPMATAELPLSLADEPQETIEEKLGFLYRCIAGLEEMDRIIISLVLEDMPQADIAAITGINPGAVRVRVHRIKEKLATQFKQHGQFE